VKEFGNGMVYNGRGKIEKEKLKGGGGSITVGYGGGGEVKSSDFRQFMTSEMGQEEIEARGRKEEVRKW
jgi:hypothetical protein